MSITGNAPTDEYERLSNERMRMDFRDVMLVEIA